MKTTSAQSKGMYTPLIIFILAVLALGAPRVFAADASSTLSAQYASWAGGKANAEALVQGLRTGSSITLSTVRPDGTTSIAGFTPRALSHGEVANALERARDSLARLGIQKPTAEQIQAALIGGEVELRDGATTMVKGVVLAAPPAPTSVPITGRRVTASR